VGLYKRVYSSTKPLKREYSSPKPLRRVYFSPTPLRRVYSSPKPLRRVYFSPETLNTRILLSHHCGLHGGGGSGQHISQFFGSGTPALVSGYQWSGWSNSGIHLHIRLFVVKSRASQGLSTDVLHLGWKSPPPPQNTSAVVGNLK